MALFKSDYKVIGQTFLERYLALGSYRNVAAWCKNNDILSPSKRTTYYTHQSIKNIIWKYCAFYPEDSHEVVVNFFDSRPLEQAPDFDEWFGFIVWYGMDSLSAGQYRRFVEKYPQAPEILQDFQSGKRELRKVG